MTKAQPSCRHVSSTHPNVTIDPTNLINAPANIIAWNYQLTQPTPKALNIQTAQPFVQTDTMTANPIITKRLREREILPVLYPINTRKAYVSNE